MGAPQNEIISTLRRDARYTVRVLRRAPALTITILLTLAIGIGAGIPVLRFVQAGLFRSNRYTDPLLRGERADWLASWTEERQTIAQLQDHGFETLLWIVFALTLLLLAVALVNIATLLLANGATRRHEIALRAVLGAGRGRIMGQLLTEGTLLVLVGGAFGLMIGIGGDHLTRASWPHGAMPWGGLAADGRVAMGVGGIFILALVLARLAPMRVAWRRDLRRFLAAGGRATADRGEAFFRNLLAVLQLAASLVLLVSAGVLLRGFVSSPEKVRGAGFDPSDTLTVQLSLPAPPSASASEQAAAYRELLREVGALPGVLDTSVATAGAWVGLGTEDPVHALTGNPVAPGSTKPARYGAVGPHHFRTLGIPVQRGREFTPEDMPGTNRAVVVNETFVQRFRLAGNPIGKRLRLHRIGLDDGWYTIVGVVKDVRSQGIGVGTEPVPALYLSALQHPPSAVGLAVRTTGDPMRLAPSVTAAIRAAAPDAVLGDVISMKEYLARFRAPLRWFAALFGILAVAALVVAASGLYGVMSYNVARRTREIGIRMALGARESDVAWLILRQCLRLVGIGAGLGLLGALGMARLLQLRFNGVEPLNPALYGGIAVTLAAVALFAVHRPVRRAASVDPQVSLREG